MIPAVVIPFRDRGTDPLRLANLECVRERCIQPDVRWTIASDGRSGNAPFNRSAAYNMGVRRWIDEADVFIFCESDMLIRKEQIEEACEMALESPGLVVPFTQYRYHTADASVCIRGGQDPEAFAPRWTMDNGRSIGAINVVSAETMRLVGQWDEVFEGNSYDDDAMKRAFEVCAGPTRWVEGSAHHLYHLPGDRGRHLTDEDRLATRWNKARAYLYAQAKTPEQIRELTMEGS